MANVVEVEIRVNKAILADLAWWKELLKAAEAEIEDESFYRGEFIRGLEAKVRELEAIVEDTQRVADDDIRKLEKAL